MYTQFYKELKSMKLDSFFWQSFYQTSENPPSNSLMPVMKEVPLVGDFTQSASNNLDQNVMVNINLIVRLIDNPNFMVSVSTDKEEIAVWDLFR